MCQYVTVFQNLNDNVDHSSFGKLETQNFKLKGTTGKASVQNPPAWICNPETNQSEIISAKSSSGFVPLKLIKGKVSVKNLSPGFVVHLHPTKGKTSVKNAPVSFHSVKGVSRLTKRKFILLLFFCLSLILS